jgi:hypothetical protein
VRESPELTERLQTLRRERAQTARKLHAGERALDGLGLLGRARNGTRLRAQATERRAQLALADAELARLERELRAAREDALAASPRPAEPERARSRDRGLELGL